MQTRRPDTDGTGERAPRPIVRWVVPGDTVGRYLVLERIGEGGMGTVFAARDPHLAREVALKVIRADTGDSYRARVMREAQALARLSHPNVVPVFDVGVDLGIVWVAMQRVRGPTLSQWLESRPPWPAVLDMFIAAGRGLAAAHAAGLVHRDFKPANVMIDEGGRVMVLDFGLAWAPGADSRPGITHASAVPGDTSPVRRMRSASGRDPLAITLTATGAVVGTPPYMAPEQHAWHEVDARSDQYALCVSIFEGIYGRRPFVGDLEQLVAAKRAGAPQRPPDPPGPTIDDRVWQVIERGMHPHPDERWPDIPTLLDALSRARRRSRRWPLVALGAAVVTLGVAAAAPTPTSAQPGECRGIAELDATWNDVRRETLRSAFATLGAASDASWPRVASRIDDTVAKWRVQAESACVAQDTTTDACLEHAAAALDEGIGVLESADPGRAARAVRLIEGLAARSCDGSRLATPPLDDAMRRRQERVRALMTAGALADAGEAATQMLVEAHAQGDTRAVAWSLILLGGSEMDRGERDIAEEHLRDALWTATAIGDDLALTTAATKLVHLCAYRFDTACAQPWLRNAEAGLARLGAAGAQAQRELDLARGDVALRAAQFDEALAHYTRALEPTRAAPADLAMFESTLVLAIGTVHASAGRHEQALQHFREAGDLEARELGRVDTARSYSLELSAGSLYALGRIAEARAALEEGLANIEAAFGEGHPHAIRAKGNLVLLMLDAGELTEARALAREVVARKKVAFGPDDIQVAIALYNLGTVHTRAGEHAAALQRYDESLALWERSQGAGHLDLSRPLSGRTNALVELGRDEEAEVAGTRARELFEAHGVPVDAELLFDLGRAAWNRGRRDEAALLIARARTALPDEARPGHLGRAGIDAWLAAHAS